MSTVTTVVNLLALATSLWLGFYIVTRSPRSRISWLATLTLWSMASLFLHNAVAINVPENSIASQLRPVIVLALPFWFHLTFLLHPEGVRWRGQTISSSASRFMMLLVYGLALAIIAGGVIPTTPPVEAEIGTAAYLSGRRSGPLYPLTIAFLILWVSLSLSNLWQGRSQARGRASRRQFVHLLTATGLASLGILYMMLGVWLRWNLPTLPGDVSLGAGVVLLGYTVVQYNALIQARTIKRDFVYAALATGLLTVFYYLFTLVLYFDGHVSFLSLMLVVVVAISSHALYDGVRVTLDRLFYQEQFRQLRANLRALARDAGTGETRPDQLQAILKSLCRALRIKKGFIALYTEEGLVVEAAQRASPGDQSLSLPPLPSVEIVNLPRPDIHVPEDMALLVPLYAGGAQLGALVLGTKESRQPYNEDDLNLIDDLADQMANVILTAMLQEKNAQAINDMVADFRAREQDLQRQVQQMLAEREEEVRLVIDGVSEKQFVSLVEDGLRRLHEYPYLGQHALAHLHVVSWLLEGWSNMFVTHIDRGKALNEVLLQALHKLRPSGTEPAPHQVPPREWYQFLVLHDAYVLGEPNRDIMSRLYISEGTFNRTRRRAIRGVTRALQEMEREAQRRQTSNVKHKE